MERKDVMEEDQWDIKEIKKLKKKQLLLGNLFMLLVFVLLVYFLESDTLFFVTWIVLACLLVSSAFSLYTLITGNLIGTKTSRRVQAFDRSHWGEKRWKRKKIIEVVLFIVLGIVLVFFLTTTDFSFPNQTVSAPPFAFIGAWVGYNIGEITRLTNLKEPSTNG